MAEEGYDNGPGNVPAPIRTGGAGRQPGVLDELLDPSAWRVGLEKYARALRLAVAVADADGHLLGECMNPQPLWAFLHTGQPFGSDCPFCPTSAGPCTCVRDALRTGRMAVVHDRTGLVHFAVPLSLNGYKVGALLAGQVFNGYPQQLALELAAKRLGLPPDEVLRRARRERPISPATLKVYAELLETLGNAFLEGRYRARQEQQWRAERDRAEEQLRRARDELERRVGERTAELKEAQHKALQVERLAAIGQMVAGLAHESRNALQRNQACLSVLGFRLEGRPEELELLERMQRAQDDLHRLYEEVREYSTPIHLAPQTCRLATLWREAWADLAPLREGTGAELREQAGVEEWECPADPSYLKQVFRKLLQNALAAGGDPPRVEVRCSAAEVGGREAVRIAIRDNGPGFAPEQRARLFEPFYTTRVRGTGLGLAICKRVVEMHGGRIEAGADPGPGAEIIITLPRSEA